MAEQQAELHSIIRDMHLGAMASLQTDMRRQEASWSDYQCYRNHSNESEKQSHLHKATTHMNSLKQKLDVEQRAATHRLDTVKEACQSLKRIGKEQKQLRDGATLINTLNKRNDEYVAAIADENQLFTVYDELIHEQPTYDVETSHMPPLTEETKEYFSLLPSAVPTPPNFKL